MEKDETQAESRSKGASQGEERFLTGNLMSPNDGNKENEEKGQLIMVKAVVKQVIQMINNL